ncbi:hypothetical protein GCM10010294_26670 [Streptomyces griseoloalbus]|nr:hypothetical protein GCM10010294_26670 [Streptomyces griseoloalbus]
MRVLCFAAALGVLEEGGASTAPPSSARTRVLPGRPSLPKPPDASGPGDLERRDPPGPKAQRTGKPKE